MIRDWTSNSSGSDVGTLRFLFWRSLFASQLEGKPHDDLEATSDRSCSNRGLVEPISAHTYIAFPGYAEAAAVTDVSAISFSLDGFIEYCELASEMGPVLQLQSTPGRNTSYMHVTGASRHLDAAVITVAAGLSSTLASDLAG